MPFIWVPKVDGPGNTIYATPLNELAAKVGNDDSTDPASLDNMVRARILKSVGTAKGSLIGFSAAGTPAEIAVGTNDKVLTADSTQASGVAWKDAPAGSGTWATLAAALDPTALADGEWEGLYEVCDTSALALRDPVYRTAAGGVAKGMATAGTSPVFGIVVEVGASGKVLWLGIIRNDAWGFTSNEKLIYVTTTGTIDDVAPAVVGDILQIVGRITKTDNVILVNPELVWVEVTDGTTLPLVGTKTGSGDVYPSSDGSGTGTVIEVMYVSVTGAIEIQEPPWTPARTGQRLLFIFNDDGNGPHTIDFATAGVYEAGDLALPTTTTDGKYQFANFMWIGAPISKWAHIGAIGGFPAA